MFISVSTSIYEELPLAKALEYIADSGFKSVEIFMTHMGRIESEGEEGLKAAKDRGINVYSVHGNPSPESSKTAPSFEEHYRKFYKLPFEFARRFGARLFVDHIGSGKLKDWPDLKEITIHNCQLLADLARGFGLTIALENDWGGGGPLRTPEQFDELIRLVGRDNFRITLDVKHAEYAEYPLMAPSQNPENFIRQVGKYIVNFHCIEVDGCAPMALGDWDIPGSGSGKLCRLVKMLKVSNYEGPITIELTERILRPVLEVVVNVLSDTGVNVEGLKKVLTECPSLEEKILEYTKKYLFRCIGHEIEY